MKPATFFGVMLAIVGCSGSGKSGTLPNGIRYSETTMETTVPLTVAEARKHWKVPFPDSATNIQIASYHEWIAVRVLVRFEAPVDDCLAGAQAIIDHYNAENRELRMGKLTLMKSPPGELGTEPFTAPWFTPQNISEGQELLPNNAPGIWVDTKRGILYYYQSD